MVGSIVDRRLGRLEKREAGRATSVSEPLSDHFRVSVSCPPDTRVHVRGGNVWEGGIWIGIGNGYYIESYTTDFASPDTIDGFEGNFANANYFMGVVFGRAFYGEDNFVIWSGDEFATAGEAEQDIQDVALLMDPWYGDDYNGGLPLCGIVLQNNGQVGVNGAVLPIDAVNRGRSYYWRDLRPRHYVVSGGPD